MFIMPTIKAPPDEKKREVYDISYTRNSSYRHKQRRLKTQKYKNKRRY